MVKATKANNKPIKIGNIESFCNKIFGEEKTEISQILRSKDRPARWANTRTKCAMYISIVLYNITIKDKFTYTIKD